MAGVPKWAEDPERVKFHQEVAEENKKCNDENYVPHKSFIIKSLKFLPAELCINSPYRAGKILTLKRD